MQNKLPKIGKTNKLTKFTFSLIIGMLSIPGVTSAELYFMSDFESMPIVVNEDSSTPMVMLNASNDHQLFFKAYNDYTDLDNNGLADTTYKNTIDYYGYFDSYKCYVYDSDDLRFEPKLVTSNKYCNKGDTTGQWSGNFLNWASMSRIDTIRKILFGGHRRVDTAGTTVLERSYLPHDAHSWAKHYDGDDLEQLVPFKSGIHYNCDKGDLTGATPPSACSDGSGGVDYRKVGITIGNTTDVNIANYNNDFSEKYTEPPLIKVVKGNYSLWGSNERWQITWSDGADFDNHSASNANDPEDSGIYSYSSSPAYSQGLGEGNYFARVLACVNEYDSNDVSLIGEEKCKLYPGADGIYGLDRNDLITVKNAAASADDIPKPIGLLQVYGDEDEMEFGMIAGSYLKHASGGVLIRNIGKISDEINVDTDGTFKYVAEFAGGIQGNNSPDAKGLINAWSLYRIVGYEAGDDTSNDGTYGDSQGDNCPWELSEFSDVTGSRCKNWGNPFSEIYYQSINYLAGGGVIGDYRSNSSTGIPGLPVPQNFEDPMDFESRCARLSVINLNSSVPSYDFDELDGQSYGPHTIWDPAVLPSNKKSTDMTNYVGGLEGLYQSGQNNYFVGETSVGAGTDDQMCTSKEVTNLGEVGGVCPEAPRLLGSYRIAGLAYYAHVNDIRPDGATGKRGLEGPQVVDTYSVALAANVPVLKIADPDPANVEKDILATIIPACRNTDFNPAGNCALVDYKIVKQEIDDDAKTVSGTLYINWEDSEQGGDYDQDMWGTLIYELDATKKTLTITTEVHAESTDYAMGFGYIVNGTDEDGFHVHSGIEGYTYPETVDSGSTSCRWGCQVSNGPSTKTYKLGSSTAELLKDPLWYASKYGGFKDKNGNNQPDLVEEWDDKDNATGESGISDGIPDTYFYADNPRQLESSLRSALDAILERTSSGTAAAVVSSNVRGEGALFQAYFRPRIKDADEHSVNWVGTVQALWLDRYGLSRQDCSPPRGFDNSDPDNPKCIPPTGPCIPNGQLDNYCVDQVVETYFDEVDERTRIRIYESSDPFTFEAFSMEGVASSYNSGLLTMVPNSLEGNTSLGADNNILTISPYTIQGTVTSYDPLSGAVTFTVASGAWAGPDNETFDQWQVNTSAGVAFGFSSSAVTLAADTKVITVSPVGTWLNVDDVITLSTHNVIGQSGKIYNNWFLECLDTSESTDIDGTSIKLQNSDDVSFYVDPATANFSTCGSAIISTYNLKGEEGDSYNNWEVANLNNTMARGESVQELELSNHGTKVLTVSPTSNWLNQGDRVLVANYSSTSTEINDISYLWNAREGLYLTGLNNPDIELLTNRLYTTPANDGRYITTWVDDNLDGKVDQNEYRDFVATMFEETTNAVPYGFFNVDTVADAKDVVNYVRGIEVPGTRSRTIKFDANDASEQVMRLGDMINSTPSIAPAPQESFDLIYNDSSYGEFRRKYLNRRGVVYSGGNDGLLHAFNAGFYTVANADGETLDQYGNILDDNCNKVGTKADDGFKASTVKYSVCGYNTDTKAKAAKHPLGSEIWAYAPMNLLSHLQWLKDPAYQYSHVYYVDGKPRLFDAKIFSDSAGETTHPNGWGTLLVVGMNLGGGLMEVDTKSDDAINASNISDNTILRSAYMIFDVTNPEEPPVLLGEIPMPDDSFTTVYPAVVTFQDTTGTRCTGDTACNRWYLQFGTGPNNMTNYTSDQSTKMYLFDLKQLTSGYAAPAASAGVPAGCKVDITSYSEYHIIECDTRIDNTFMGTPVVVDWDLDFMADSAYFGLVGDANADQGRIMRMAFSDSEDPSGWGSMHTLYQTDQPITVQPSPGMDNKKNKWLFFGTGRYFANADKTSDHTQSLYGIKDNWSNTPVPADKILDTSDVEVFSDGKLQNPLIALNGTGSLGTFDEIVSEIDTNASGWKMDLPPIIGLSTDTPPPPATRNLTRSALFGGVLFSTVFQPSADPCEGEGNSRLYGLFYKTGTAFPSPSVLGSTIFDDNGDVKYLSKKYLELGRGFATAPAIHSGSGGGGDQIRVLTQLSTGNIVSNPAAPVFNVRTGRTAWGEN